MPAEAASADAVAVQAALDAQQAKLAEIVDAQSGLRLRRTRSVAGGEATTKDAIIRDEPYEGKVKYLVHLQGVADKVAKSLESEFGTFEVRRVDFVDARVAEDLRTRGVLALGFALLAILIYLAIRFDAFFAPGALVATLHDPLIAMGLFVFLRMEFDTASIAAMLTVVGYSVNGVIVIYDRIRETTPAGVVEHKDLVTLDEFLQRLQQFRAQEPDGRVLINGDERAFFAQAIYVFDEARKAGFTKVFIETRVR